MTDDIHSCSYYCTRPACVLAQRNEMRNASPPDHLAVMRQALSALDDYEVRYCELFAHAGLGDPTTDSVAVTIGRSAMDALRAALEPKQC